MNFKICYTIKEAFTNSKGEKKQLIKFAREEMSEEEICEILAEHFLNERFYDTSNIKVEAEFD